VRRAQETRALADEPVLVLAAAGNVLAVRQLRAPNVAAAARLVAESIAPETRNDAAFLRFVDTGETWRWPLRGRISRARGRGLRACDAAAAARLDLREDELTHAGREAVRFERAAIARRSAS
jgi:hypothetical protein